jgi:hypothetical protein
MSRDVSISAFTSSASFSKVLGVLLETGWQVRDVAGTSYLPLSAVDVSDWKMFSADSVDLVLEECRRRESVGLQPGLVLLRKNDDWGGQFLWLDGRVLVATLNVNVSDDWDLGRAASDIGRPLEEAGIALERFVVERG